VVSPWLRWSLFATFIVLVLGVAFAAELQEAKIYNQAQPAQANQQNKPPSSAATSLSSQESAKKGNQKGHWYDTFWHHPTDWLLVLFNCILATFTVRLFYATSGLAAETAGLRSAADKQSSDMQASIQASVDSAKAAVTSNQIAVTNAEQRLRAYVTVQEIQMNTHRQPSTFPGTEFWRREVQGAVHTYEFTPVLRNGGQTPAINVVASVTLRRFAEGVPADFGFPDEGEHAGGVIGPQTEWYAPPQSASAGIVNPDDPTPLLLWGSVEYDDIFSGSFRHRTEFCFQTHVKRVPITGDTWVGFVPYRRYNNVDENCEADFDPHENKYH
jgi:hypothetical protein